MDSDKLTNISDLGNGEGGDEDSTKNSKEGEESVHQTRQQIMRKKLKAALNPVVLELEDVSYQHLGHSGIEKGASETHFNLKIISSEFEDKSY